MDAILCYYAIPTQKLQYSVCLVYSPECIYRLIGSGIMTYRRMELPGNEPSAVGNELPDATSQLPLAPPPASQTVSHIIMAFMCIT
jgi:hypothetical protein